MDSLNELTTTEYALPEIIKMLRDCELANGCDGCESRIICGNMRKKYSPLADTSSFIVDFLGQLEVELAKKDNRISDLEKELAAAKEDIYLMGGCSICKWFIGRHPNTGLPMCSKHYEFPSGCFEWRGAQERRLNDKHRAIDYSTTSANREAAKNAADKMKGEND